MSKKSAQLQIRILGSRRATQESDLILTPTSLWATQRELGWLNWRKRLFLSVQEDATQKMRWGLALLEAN